MNQRTVNSVISCEGVGIHSGAITKLRFLPAQEDTGIIFIRKDLDQDVVIPVSVASVSHANRATVLEKDGVRIKTPEHLLAACYGLGICNLIIEIEGEEIPIMDGSALPFVSLFLEVGIREQHSERRKLVIESPSVVKLGEKTVLALPSETPQFSAVIEYSEEFIGQQILTWSLDYDDFESSIAPARTYGFYSEYQALLDKGLAHGASRDNVVVIGDLDYLTELRFPDELVRHKLLDLLGDLSILGPVIVGHLVAIKAGHETHLAMVKELAKKLHAPVVD